MSNNLKGMSAGLVATLVLSAVMQFKSAMGDLFDPHQFKIAASDTRYAISARAKDRRRTVVTLSGPLEDSAPSSP